MHIEYRGKHKKELIKIENDELLKNVKSKFIQEEKIVDFFVDDDQQKSTKVADVHRYQLHYNFKENNWILKELKDSIPNINELGNSKTIIIILESPHKDEFVYLDEKDMEVNILNRKKENTNLSISKIKPSFAASGHTREMIDKYFIEIINKIDDIEIGTYEVIITNPVPYQTSLFAIHGKSLNQKGVKKLRDEVWEKLWDINEIKCDFIKRLTSYQPSIIFNCCTSSLSKWIDYFLLCINLKAQYYKSPHPSSWIKPKNRRVSKLTQCEKILLNKNSQN